MSKKQNEKAKESRFYWNMLVGGVSVYSLTQLCKYQLETYRKKKAIIQADKSKVYTPDQLLKKIRERTNNLQNLSRMKGFSYTNSERTEVKGRVFLTGLIKCEKSILSSSYKVGDPRMKGLIYKIKYDEDKYSLDPADSSKREYKLKDFPINSVFEKVKNFIIQDQQGTGTCEVRLDEDMDVTRALQLIGQRDRLINVTIGQRFISFLILLIKLICDLFYGNGSPLSRSIRGIRLGITEKEIGIKVDSITSVYGEIFFNLETGKLRFDFPNALVNDKSQFIYKLKESFLESRFFRNFFGAIFASTLIYFGRRIYLYWKYNPTMNPFVSNKEETK